MNKRLKMYQRKDRKMSLIRPFKGIRPAKQFAAKVASPPYDVLNSEEARELAKDNPMSFLHVVKPEIDLPSDVDHYDDSVYNKAVENFKKFRDEKILIQDELPSIYLYRQQMGDHIQTGLVAAVSVDEYENNLIKKHEFTRKDKEDDRTRHVNDTDCNAGPVFLTYRADKNIDFLIEKYSSEAAEIDFTADDGIRHTLWPVNSKETINKFVLAFEKIPCMYVADGHHRTASGARVREIRRKANANHTGLEEYNFFMAVLFPHNQLKILDYNRAVMDLNGMTKDEFMGQVSENFDISKATDGKVTRTHDFGMYIDGSWHKLSAKEGTFDANDPVGKLDVSILQNNLLNPLLGIDDPRTNNRINFIGGIRGTKELEKMVNHDGFAVAFSMFPTSTEELMDIADADAIMPPKSTWFEPKLRSGLVIHLLSEK